MIGKIILLATVAMASAATVSRQGWDLANVDPNTLSCDPEGQVFLLLPHEEDCGSFYMCVHGTEVLFPCPGGLIFDFPLQTCNWPDAASCTLRGENSGDDSVEAVDGSGDGPEWDEDVASRSHQAIETDAALLSGVHEYDHGVSQLNCQASSSGLAAHRGDCQRYWRCANGAPEAAFCSDGLYFNPKSLQCDFEANVPCARDAHEEIGEEFLKY